MPTFNYQKMVDLASSLLTKFGTDVTVTYSVSETFDPVTQTNVKVESTFTGKGVVVPYNQLELDNSTIEAGDLRLILEQTSQAPEIDNKVIWQGVEYRIQAVEKKSPGGIDIVYFCQLRV